MDKKCTIQQGLALGIIGGASAAAAPPEPQHEASRGGPHNPIKIRPPLTPRESVSHAPLSSITGSLITECADVAQLVVAPGESQAEAGWGVAIVLSGWCGMWCPGREKDTTVHWSHFYKYHEHLSSLSLTYFAELVLFFSFSRNSGLTSSLLDIFFPVTPTPF